MKRVSNIDGTGPRMVSLLLSFTVLLVGFSGSQGCSRGSGGRVDGPVSLGELADAQGSNRPVEGRLSGGFVFAPYDRSFAEKPPALRGAAHEPHSESAESADLAPLAAAVFEETMASPSSDALHKMALLNLLKKKVRKAVETLEEAVAISPDNGRLKSDLAAAYIEDGRLRDAPNQYARALALADEAVAADESLLEARFNRALALERLVLMSEARDAWNDYLSRDPSSRWADEVRSRVAALEAPSLRSQWEDAKAGLEAAALGGDAASVQSVVARFPQFARDHASELLGSAWPDAVDSGRAQDADRAVRIVREIGDALSALQGDGLVSDLVSAIHRTAVQDRSPDGIATLADAHRALREGRLSFARREVAVALPPLAQAKAAFERVGDIPGALLAEYEIARCRIVESDYRRALSIVERLRPIAEKRAYLFLTGRLRWVAGYAHSRLRFDVEAMLRDYFLAARYLEATGDLEGRLNVQMLLAQVYEFLGDYENAWTSFHDAMTSMGTLGLTEQRSVVLCELADIPMSAKEPAAARYYLDAAVNLASRADEPTVLTLSLGKRAFLRSRTGDGGGAAEDLARAQETFAGIDDPAFKKRLDVELAIADVDIGSVPPDRAVRRLTEILGTIDASSFRLRIVLCHALRARAYKALGDDERAEADLRASLHEIEYERGRLPSSELRINFFQGAQDLYDEMIAFQVERRGRTDEAFRFAEQSRARALLDDARRGNRMTSASGARVSDSGVSVTAPEQVSRLLPEGTVLVQYSVQSSASYAWVITRSGCSFVRLAIDEFAMRAQCERFRSAVERDDPEVEIARLSTPIFSMLVAPVKALVPPGSTILVVPDKALHLIPFGALVDPETGTYMLRDHAIAICPSASVFAHGVARREALRFKGESRALVVGEPAFDRSLFPNLDSLPASGYEAQRIAGLYDNATILVGARATRAAFLEAAPKATVIHFAGHAIRGVDDQNEPALLMASDPNGDGTPGASLLGAARIRALRLPNATTVVLAACRTAEGRPVGGEGNMSLARAFLSGGAVTVVATMWDVGDGVTARIATALHEELRRGTPAASALRAAILRVLDADSSHAISPSQWAPFVVYGA